MVVGVLIVFDPLGSLRRPRVTQHSDLRDLESSESSQRFSTARSLAVRVWESRLRLLCCCLPQDDNNRAAFSGIAQLFSDFFSVSPETISGCRLVFAHLLKCSRCILFVQLIHSIPLSRTRTWCPVTLLQVWPFYTKSRIKCSSAETLKMLFPTVPRLP